MECLSLRKIPPYEAMESTPPVRRVTLRLRPTDDARERAHGIRGSLTVVLGYLDLLEEGCFGEPTPGQKRAFGLMRASLEEAVGLTDASGERPSTEWTQAEGAGGSA